MSRRGWLAATGAALAVTACGCLSTASTLADLPPLPAVSVAASPETTRGQMPDAPTPSNNAVCHLINLPVDRPAEAAHANPAATIHAVVNGELILHEEVLISCASQMPGARSKEERDEIIKRAVESLIDREVLLQDAIARLKRGGKQGEAFLKKIEEMADEAFAKVERQMLKEKHLSSRAELMDFMRRHGMSLQLFRRYWERNWMAQNYLGARLEPQINRIGHTEVAEYYNSHRDQYMQPDSVDWQDIFLDAARHASRAAAHEFAEALVQRVQQGEDFTKLSAEFDNGESRLRKGAGQGHKRGEIFPPEAEPVLFQMHEGDMKIIERPHGYHVIRLVKRQYAGPIPFDAKVQKEIHDKIRNEVFQREKESMIKDLKRKAVIDRCD
jgi:peptidyl-prolyl cis-trans isomerase SurA